MERSEKKQLVEKLKETFDSKDAIIILRVEGITVSEITHFRKKLRQKNSSVQYIKNTLVRRALMDSPYAGLGVYCTGPVAFVFGENIFDLNLLCDSFSKETAKVKVLSASLKNTMLSEDNVKALKKFHSAQHLQATILGTMQAPMRKLMALLKAYAEQGCAKEGNA